jgi:hypothetical protein
MMPDSLLKLKLLAFRLLVHLLTIVQLWQSKQVKSRQNC